MTTVYEQRDTSVPRKHHAEIEATGLQVKPETYAEWLIALNVNDFNISNSTYISQFYTLDVVGRDTQHQLLFNVSTVLL